ncbi:MAG: hypothetical protein K940chlam9_01193 [Chlamydiae bacterium]|nr:hypothetical protein [Chlamydiota bacterium]
MKFAYNIKGENNLGDKMNNILFAIEDLVFLSTPI